MKRRRKATLACAATLAALSVLAADAHATDTFNVHEEFQAALAGAGATCPNPTYEYHTGDRSYVTGDCVAHFGTDVMAAQVWSRMIIRHEVAHLATIGHAHDPVFRTAEARLLNPVGIFTAYAHPYTPALEGTGDEYPKYASTQPLSSPAHTSTLSLTARRPRS